MNVKKYAIVYDGDEAIFVCNVKEGDVSDYLKAKLEAATNMAERKRLETIRDKRIEELSQAVCALQAEIKHLKGEDEDVGND